MQDPLGLPIHTNASTLEPPDKLFRHAVNSAPTGLWLSDEQGVVTYLNQTLVDWTGIPHEDLVGFGWLDAVVEADRRQTIDQYIAALTERKHYQAQFRLTKYDGSIIWCRAGGDPYYDDEGNFAGYSGYCMDINELVTTQQKVEDNRTELLRLFEQSPIAVAIISKHKLTFKLANPFYGALAGRKPEDIIGKPLLEALPELKGQGFDKLLESVIETGKPVISNDVMVTLRRGDVLEPCFVDFAYQPLRESDNTISGVLVVATDTTQKVTARKRIEASEAKFRSLVEQAPFATALYVGPDLIIDTANDAMIKLWGKTSSVIGTRLEEALPELEGQPFIGLLQQVMSTGQVYSAREQSADLVVDGKLQRYWFNFTYKPLIDDSGKVYAILNMAVDVTYQVDARNKIEKAESMLSEAIELAELATWNVDLVNGITTYSQRLQQWLGVNDAKQAGNGLDMVLEKDRERVNQALMRATMAGGDGRLDEVYTIINRETGRQRIIHAVGQAGFDKQGKVITLSGTAQDLTVQMNLQLALEAEVNAQTAELAQGMNDLAQANDSLEETNKQLLRSNEELAQYAYVASHDLQEPLRKIRMFSDILMNNQLSDEEQKRILEKISSSTARMSLLIKDLLEFSRLIKSEALFRPVNLNNIVQDVIADFELVIAEKNAHVSVGQLPVIAAVSLQMNQLFYNLIGNALKFSKTTGSTTIDISARKASRNEVADMIDKPLPDTDYYVISVHDNGIGFDAMYLEQIFEMFKRLHGKHEYGGSGIGLAICRRVALNHGGVIYANSQTGEGSGFHVMLPERQPAL